MEFIGYCKELYKNSHRETSALLDTETCLNEHFKNALLYEKFKKYKVPTKNH